jgi:hypothetical protein
VAAVASVATDERRHKARWFGQAFRKVHTLYVSPPWARGRGVRFDAEATAARLAAADVDGVELYCKDHHGVCYYPSSVGLAYPRDIVGELCAAVQSRGMRFIAYFSVGFDSYALGVHPEWRATDRDGEPRRQPPFLWACLGSPYRANALTQLDELIGNYPIDGLWLDIVPFAWDRPQALWMQTALPVPCYCHSCQARFEGATGQPLPRERDELSPLLRRKVTTSCWTTFGAWSNPPTIASGPAGPRRSSRITVRMVPVTRCGWATSSRSRVTRRTTRAKV